MRAEPTWTEIHSLDAFPLLDILAAYQAGLIVDDPFEDTGQPLSKGTGQRLPTLYECYTRYICPSLMAAFGQMGSVVDDLQQIRFKPLEDGPDAKAHTIDAGDGTAPPIAMNWQGRPADLLCLAHETGHALQSLLSDHGPMPPTARETCAFLAELMVLDHVRIIDPTLFANLHDVWVEENLIYLGSDLDSLSAALQNQTTPSQYRHNYPLARLAAVAMFLNAEATAIFTSGFVGLGHLPLYALADKAGKIDNTLPAMPTSLGGQSVHDAYRVLGATVLLDVQAWSGTAAQPIDQYYADMLAHTRDRTASLSIGPDRKPIGYTAWDRSGQLTRLVAPFGNHARIAASAKRHMTAKQAA